MLIDIGTPAIERSLITTSNYTYILKDNPANASGKITKVEIVCSGSVAGLEIATFFNVSGTIFSTRDTHFVGGLGGGYREILGLNITVEQGDYIGFYVSAGSLQMDSEGGTAYWFVSGDFIPCTNATFTYTGSTTRILSLYGTGVTVPPPPCDSARTGIYILKTLK